MFLIADSLVAPMLYCDFQCMYKVILVHNYDCSLVISFNKIKVFNRVAHFWENNSKYKHVFRAHESLVDETRL